MLAKSDKNVENRTIADDCKHKHPDNMHEDAVSPRRQPALSEQVFDKESGRTYTYWMHLASHVFGNVAEGKFVLKQARFPHINYDLRGLVTHIPDTFPHYSK